MAELREIIQDRTQPLDVRIDAVKKLSQESREYNELRNILFSVIEPEDEDPNLRSVALAVLSFRNPAASIQLLVRPFENSAVRRTAIEILDKLAPVTGEQEALSVVVSADQRGRR